MNKKYFEFKRFSEKLHGTEGAFKYLGFNITTFVYDEIPNGVGIFSVELLKYYQRAGSISNCLNEYARVSGINKGAIDWVLDYFFEGPQLYNHVFAVAYKEIDTIYELLDFFIYFDLHMKKGMIECMPFKSQHAKFKEKLCQYLLDFFYITLESDIKSNRLTLPKVVQNYIKYRFNGSKSVAVLNESDLTPFIFTFDANSERIKKVNSLIEGSVRGNLDGENIKLITNEIKELESKKRTVKLSILNRVLDMYPNYCNKRNNTVVLKNLLRITGVGSEIGLNLFLSDNNSYSKEYLNIVLTLDDRDIRELNLELLFFLIDLNIAKKNMDFGELIVQYELQEYFYGVLFMYGYRLRKFDILYKTGYYYEYLFFKKYFNKYGFGCFLFTNDYEEDKREHKSYYYYYSLLNIYFDEKEKLKMCSKIDTLAYTLHNPVSDCDLYVMMKIIKIGKIEDLKSILKIFPWYSEKSICYSIYSSMLEMEEFTEIQETLYKELEYKVATWNSIDIGFNPKIDLFTNKVVDIKENKNSIIEEKTIIKHEFNTCRADKKNEVIKILKYIENKDSDFNIREDNILNIYFKKSIDDCLMHLKNIGSNKTKSEVVERCKVVDIRRSLKPMYSQIYEKALEFCDIEQAIKFVDPYRTDKSIKMLYADKSFLLPLLNDLLKVNKEYEELKSHTSGVSPEEYYYLNVKVKGELKEELYPEVYSEVKAEITEQYINDVKEMVIREYEENNLYTKNERENIINYEVEKKVQKNKETKALEVITCVSNQLIESGIKLEEQIDLLSKIQQILK